MKVVYRSPSMSQWGRSVYIVQKDNGEMAAGPFDSREEAQAKLDKMTSRTKRSIATSAAFKPVAFVNLAGKVWHTTCFAKAKRDGALSGSIDKALAHWPGARKCAWCGGGAFGRPTSEKKR